LRLRADPKPGKREDEMLIRTLAVALALSLAGAAAPARAGTTRYDPQRAGHPLRMVAYALHPVGVVLDTLIFHPAWWLGTHEPLRTLFGVEVVFDDSAEVARAAEARRAHPPAVEPPAPTDPETEAPTN
jgi:hypothetical protein